LTLPLKEFANKKARKVTVQTIVVFMSEFNMGLIFILFLLFFPIRHFVFCLTDTYNV